MTILKQVVFASLCVFALLSTVAAQDNTTTQRTSLTITAAAAGDRVRITAPSSVVQMRVEVYAASGEKLFDQEIRGGNVFDWHLQDGQAQRLAPGTYVCVVTAKSISGKLSQKIGTVSVAEKSVSVQPAESQQLSAPQAQTIGPVEENSSWTIPAKDEPQTPTVIANDGTDGQMIRGRGALTFRIGNFFSGIDQEQMRLTKDGRLGIGTSNPQAQLDVAGTIRAQRFLVAKSNTTSSDRKAQASAQATDDANSVQPLASGTGTQDRIAKWTDNAGTLGDSGITEVGGNVGIGTTTPGSKLVVSANSATLPPASGVARFADADGVQTAVFADAFGTNPIFNVRRSNGTAAVPSALQANQLLGVIGASGFGTSAYSGTRARVAFLASENWTNTANGSFITFNTTANGAATSGGTERLRIDNAGNVGIGTTSPAAKLDVAGNINTSTQYNIGGASGLRVPGGNNVYVGPNSGPTSVSLNNSIVGAFAGSSTIMGNDNSFFGKDAGLSATGNHNSFFGEEAGFFNGAANDNTFIGFRADFNEGFNQGNQNTLIGSKAAANKLINNATAIGANALVTKDNSLVLGSVSGFNGATADTKVGIGTTAPLKHLHVAGASDQEVMIESTDTNGIQWTLQSSSGASNGRFEIIDRTANLSRMTILNTGNVGVGTTAPADKLHVNGILRVQTLGAADTTTALCRNSSNQIATCNSSSLRYKTAIEPFTGGLEIVNRLRPIRFTWKQGGARDLGFGAEEVAKVEPLLTFTNERGEIEGVKYDRLNVVLINAVKQQQAQIGAQQKLLDDQRRLITRQQVQIDQQQKMMARQSTEFKQQQSENELQQIQINGLKKLVCWKRSKVGVCRQ